MTIYEKIERKLAGAVDLQHLEVVNESGEPVLTEKTTRILR